MSKRWWHRLWHAHSWDDGREVDLIYGQGHVHEFTCTECGKKRYTTTTPINFIG